MIQITISGNNAAELKAAAASLQTLLSSPSEGTVTAVLSAAEQSRLRGDATVVAPKDDKVAKAKAAKEAKALAEAAAKAAAEQAGDGEADEGDEGDEAEGDGSAEDTGTEGGDGEAEVTLDDVKALLMAVREATKDAKIIASIVKEVGKADVVSKSKELPAIAAHCKALLAKHAKKAGKK